MQPTRFAGNPHHRTAETVQLCLLEISACVMAQYSCKTQHANGCLGAGLPAASRQCLVLISPTVSRALHLTAVACSRITQLVIPAATAPLRCPRAAAASAPFPECSCRGWGPPPSPVLASRSFSTRPTVPPLPPRRLRPTLGLPGTSGIFSLTRPRRPHRCQSFSVVLELSGNPDASPSAQPPSQSSSRLLAEQTCSAPLYGVPLRSSKLPALRTSGAALLASSLGPTPSTVLP
ncbi:hypothetical protein R5R35_012394 [Gryllus longicercus]|uniref:Uncharacterized protein n=1 Tax=Gryllus longicercus TaxID=2509291 RepID=A0AAN9V6A4_9ORTH